MDGWTREQQLQGGARHRRRYPALMMRGLSLQLRGTSPGIGLPGNRFGGNACQCIGHPTDRLHLESAYVQMTVPLALDNTRLRTSFFAIMMLLDVARRLLWIACAMLGNTWALGFKDDFANLTHTLGPDSPSDAGPLHGFHGFRSFWNLAGCCPAWTGPFLTSLSTSTTPSTMLR